MNKMWIFCVQFIYKSSVCLLHHMDDKLSSKNFICP